MQGRSATLWLCVFPDGPACYAPARSQEGAAHWCEARGHGAPERVTLAGYAGTPDRAQGDKPQRKRPRRRSFQTADAFLHLYYQTQIKWPTRILGAMKGGGGGGYTGGACRLLDLVTDVGTYLVHLPLEQQRVIRRVWVARIQDWLYTAKGERLRDDEPPRSTHRRLEKRRAYLDGMAWLDDALRGLLPRQLTIREHFERILMAEGLSVADAKDTADRLAQIRNW